MWVKEHAVLVTKTLEIYVKWHIIDYIGQNCILKNDNLKVSAS